jgi:hypothetical protein
MSLELFITQSGAKSFNNKLRSFLSRSGSILEQDTEILAREAVDTLTTYPPESEGNFPPPPYWERGVGLVGGQGQLYRPSQRYGDSGERWEYNTSTVGDTVTTVATTDITYAPYLGDPKRQAGFHARRGWKTTEQAIMILEHSPALKVTLQNAVSRVAKLLGM